MPLLTSVVLPSVTAAIGWGLFLLSVIKSVWT